MSEGMATLTDHITYADAQRLCSPARLWELFDGDRQRLNIAHECIDRHPADRVAVRLVHSLEHGGGDETFTFGQLAAWSARFAHYLADRAIGPGDRVGIMLEPSLPFYAGLFGAVKRGAIAVPLFTLFGPDGLRLRIDDCTPRLLLVSPAQAGIARDVPGLASVVADDAFLATLATYPTRYAPDTRADQLAVFQYTSGTTRELPAAVRHTHRSIVTLMVAALYGTGAYAGKFDADRLLRALAEHEISNLSAAATHYRMMKSAGTASRYRYAIRKLSFTGEPIDEAARLFAEATFGAPVCSMYGTTEVGVILASYPGAPDFVMKPGSLGKPVPGVEVEVQRADSTRCAPDETGEIRVKRRDGWFPTKDRGWTDADGYFYHGGRADDVIISAGWTISAVEVEGALLKHSDVREAAVIGVPDELRGLVVKAFIVSPRRGDPAFARELQEWTRTRLAQHEYPRQVEFVTELPKTPAGKVNRKVLREREAGASVPTP